VEFLRLDTYWLVTDTKELRKVVAAQISNKELPGRVSEFNDILKDRHAFTRAMSKSPIPGPQVPRSLIPDLIWPPKFNG
jgi:hypothetical protein